MKPLLTFVALCSLAVPGLRAAEELPALKDLYAGKFLIGAAIGADVALQPDHPLRPLVKQQFNSLVSTNLMKWGPYNPQPGEYNDAPAGAYFGYGKAQDMYMVGHTLFWHAQTPKWVFEDTEGQPLAREALLKRMRERVQRVAKLYGPSTDAWDVVNEAIVEDGSVRPTSFSRILGDEWVIEAFKIANEELPKHIALLYNDYNMETPGRLASVVKLVHDLRAKGLRIDAVGSQAHWRLETPTIAQIEASIVALRDAGVKVHFTELDIEVLPRNVGGAEISMREKRTEDNDPYTAGLPAEIQEKLARRYADIFKLFLKHADVVDRVTFWGVTDGDSWLNSWPVRGRTNHPLLFDRQLQPKPAFHAVAEAAKQP
ncbi:Endo-1,4-beta-xylanase A precursor [Lacunisphaera limnophila]|uniref:Beta-xylanase n=1 Tax=Lacunisphaera limnophila TaxID=1838286 RepID=A0A1D8AZP0_9BACT|nr:endo-1,4-beta-xylanase [Lacunisphaera limnophila]AOS46368.1 Endo-1,4-beta-xylanase A precursor [Lacunisphaera limnophila]